MARLLTLTFHQAGSRLREDALFKKAALASPLIDEEALGDSFPEELAESDKAGPASGLTKRQYADTTQISLNRVGFNAWWREPFKSPRGGESGFEDWIGERIREPCHCLLVAGHHSFAGPNAEPVVWGQTDRRARDHRWFTAFLPRVADQKPVLRVMGHPYKPRRSAVLRAGPFDCTMTLQACRLIIVMGCNGTGWRGALGGELGLGWQTWANTGRADPKKPIILGWYGSLKMPRDADQESFSEPFWQGLAELSSQHGNATLQALCENHAEGVIATWGEALKQAYGASQQQRHLWFDGSRGAGAIDPEGGIWRVRRAQGPIEKVG